MAILDDSTLPFLVGGALVVGVLALLLLVRRVARPGRFGRRTVRVVGVGDGGANTIAAMMRTRTKGIDYVAVNTDPRALRRSRAKRKVAIGQSSHGLGSGGEAAIGEAAARDAAESIAGSLAGSDMVVIAGGLGGGTASGAMPVVAEIARQQGALTIAVVTRPFMFEGARKRLVSEAGMRELLGKVDAVASLPNERVRDVVTADVSIEQAFRAIDETLQMTIQAILDLAAARGRISLDFGTARSVLRDAGPAFVGLGRAAGENRAVEATRQALAAALLEAGTEGARSIVLNVTASRKLKLAELDQAVEAVVAVAGPEADVAVGMTVDGRLGGMMQVTLIASGFKDAPAGTDSTSAPWLPVWRRDRSAAETVASDVDAERPPQPRRGRRAVARPEPATLASRAGR